MAVPVRWNDWDALMFIAKRYGEVTICAVDHGQDEVRVKLANGDVETARYNRDFMMRANHPGLVVANALCQAAQELDRRETERVGKAG